MLVIGLTSLEVHDRQKRGLVNRVKTRVWLEYGSIVVRNLATWFNALVVPASIALYHLEEYRGAIAVIGMMVINTIVGLTQEIVAKARLNRLTLVAATQVRVIRDNKTQSISTEEVVQDDVVQLAVGELIVADGIVLESSFLEVDEALLTGEADPIPRKVGDKLLAGSFCVTGEGYYRAEQVGPKSTAQQIAQHARSHRYAAGPIQQAIDRTVRLLSYAAISLSLLYIIRFWLTQFPPTELAQMVAATITSMVPQGLVLTATLALTLGAIRLTLRGAVVQRLDAVESMAAVNVLCLDKTGTLTTNRLQLERYICLNPDVAEPIVRDRIRLFISAAVDQTNKVLSALRDAMGQTTVEKLDELPFKAQNRFSAVRVNHSEGPCTLVLGAAEALMKYLDSARRGHVEAVWKEQLSSGLRLLLFMDTTASIEVESWQQSGTLRPLALLAFQDEVRPEAVAALSALHDQGIAFKILSGDNPTTVRATLAGLALPMKDDEVVSGEDLSSSTDTKELIRRARVFGRLSPQQKLQIISTLQNQGRFVAMLGDGVNDILSIKQADLGIAMGAGSAATKSVASLVLWNNDFNLLPAAMNEARIVVHNLRRASKLFLVKNVYTFVLILVVLIFSGLAFPYLPQQVTLLNLLTVGLPAMVLLLGRTTGERAERTEFYREIAAFVLRTGVVLSLAGSVLLMFSAWGRADSPMVQRTLLLALMIIMTIQTVFRVIRKELCWTSLNDWVLLTLTALAVLAFHLLTLWAWAADFFRLQSLARAEWGLVLAVALPTVIIMETWDRRTRTSSRLSDNKEN
ncbi:MAG: HAD-IC family P-type ATPase [Gemmatales bacterium]